MRCVDSFLKRILVEPRHDEFLVAEVNLVIQRRLLCSDRFAVGERYQELLWSPCQEGSAKKYMDPPIGDDDDPGVHPQLMRRANLGKETSNVGLALGKKRVYVAWKFVAIRHGIGIGVQPHRL